MKTLHHSQRAGDTLAISAGARATLYTLYHHLHMRLDSQDESTANAAIRFRAQDDRRQADALPVEVKDRRARRPRADEPPADTDGIGAAAAAVAPVITQGHKPH